MQKDALLNMGKSTFAIAGIVVVFATVWALKPRAGTFQQKTRAFYKSQPVGAHEPLKIVGIKAARRTLGLSEQFNAADDWLRDAELTVKKHLWQGHSLY